MGSGASFETPASQDEGAASKPALSAPNHATAEPYENRGGFAFAVAALYAGRRIPEAPGLARMLEVLSITLPIFILIALGFAATRFGTTTPSDIQALGVFVLQYALPALVFKSLAQRPGHVKNRDQLMDAAYGEHIYVDDRTIDSHIKRLRKKFKAVDGEFAQIETLYGVGYRYREQ